MDVFRVTISRRFLDILLHVMKRQRSEKTCAHLNYSTEIHLDVNLILLPLWTGGREHQPGNKQRQQSEE